MASTDIGVSSNTRPSSRVLKPPGGGHSNIFAEPEVSVNAPRPKYNQQNSSNLSACVGATDANQAVVKLREEIQGTKNPMEDNNDNRSNETPNNEKGTCDTSKTNNGNNSNEVPSRGRVPPGGYSSGGFW